MKTTQGKTASFLSLAFLVPSITLFFVFSVCNLCLATDSDHPAPHLMIPTGHTTNCIAFSKDGRFLASAGSDRVEIRIWEIESGRLLKIMGKKDNTSRVFSLAFSPDGKLLVSGQAGLGGGGVSLWRISDGKLLHTDPCLDVGDSVSFSPDGQLFVSSSSNYFALWRVLDGKILRKTPTSTGTIFSGFAPDGSLIVSGKRIVQLWNISEGRIIRNYQGNKDIKTVLVSPDGKFIAVCTENDSVTVLRFSDFKSVKSFSDIGMPFAFSLDCQYILNLRNFKTLEYRSFVDGTLHYNMDIKRDGSGNCENREGGRIGYHSDSGLLALVCDSGSIKLFQPSTGRVLRYLGNAIEGIKCVSFSHDGRFLVSGGSDKTIKFWDFQNNKLMRVVKKGHENSHEVAKKKGYLDTSEGSVTTLAYSPDDRMLATGSGGDSIKLWEAASGKLIQTFAKGIFSRFDLVSFSPDGSLVASPTEDSVKLWRVSDGALQRTFKGTPNPYPTLMIGKKPSNPYFYTGSISPDGKIIAAGGDDQICLWNIADGKFIRSLDAQALVNEDACWHIAFSPDSRFLASDSTFDAGGDVKIWQISDGKLLRKLRGHGPLTFDPSGRFLAFQNNDSCRIQLARIADGKLVNTVDGCGALAFSPDGRFLAVGSNTITIYAVENAIDKLTLKSEVDIIGFENGEYVYFTQDGYYDSSSEATNLIGWSFDGDVLLEGFPFSQFEGTFKRPDIIKARLSGNAKVDGSPPPITRPPYIEMADHQQVRETSESTYALALTTSAIDEVKTLRIFVNGKPSNEIPVNAKEKALTTPVHLFPGSNRITAIAYNEKGFSSNPKYVDVLCKRSDLPKPDLYILGFGVSKYPNLPQEWQLSYAHSDAKAMNEAFKGQEGRFFGHVSSKILTNDEVTADNLVEVLNSLEGMSGNDVAVLFLAGHGVMGKDGGFYFLTPNGTLDEPEKGGVNWKTLGESLAKVKGRVLILLDACHSGNVTTETVVPNDELAQKLRAEGRSGLMVFTASKGRQSALESPDLGGGFGAFAYAVTQALGPKAKEADLNGNGFVEFMELVDYVSQSVDKETEGEQTPWLARKELFGDLPIASVQ